MLLSIPTDNLFDCFSFEEALSHISNGGFTAFELSLKPETSKFNKDNYIKNATELKNISDRLGLVCNQVHILSTYNGKFCTDYTANIIRGLEISSILCSKICVVQPNVEFTAKENKEKIFDVIYPYCKKFNIKVAIENVWKFSQSKDDIRDLQLIENKFIEQLNILDSKVFGACLNTSKVEDCDFDRTIPNIFNTLNSTLINLVYTLKDRLFTIHVGDNDRYAYLQTFPFNGRIDWQEFFKAIKDVNYSGDLAFEPHRFIDHAPKELKPAFIKFLGSIGNLLLSKI